MNSTARDFLFNEMLAASDERPAFSLGLIMLETVQMALLGEWA